MTFTPIAPTTYVPPTEIAKDTFVIHQVQPALGQPLFVYLNSMVILGREPMIVDTGTIANREKWLEDVFALVEPKDVRWIYLSHDDVDHTGNLEQVMEACPNATLVCTWAMVERHTNCFSFPLARCRWLNEGEAFDAGDRQLVARRPPVWDSPTTRGLWDASTGVYWAVDSFATPLVGVPVEEIEEMDPEFWQFGMTLFAHGAVAPWLALVDDTKFQHHVDGIQNLDIQALASCHSPVLRGAKIDEAFAIVRTLATADPPALPDQAVLEQIVAAIFRAPE